MHARQRPRADSRVVAARWAPWDAASGVGSAATPESKRSTFRAVSGADPTPAPGALGGATWVDGMGRRNPARAAVALHGRRALRRAGCGSGEAGRTKAAVPARRGTGHAVSAQVRPVIDGDTIEVSIRGDEEDIRYIGVDTPETVKPGTRVQCFGPRPAPKTSAWWRGARCAWCSTASVRDVYGRLLAYVYTWAGGGGDLGSSTQRWSVAATREP